MSDIYYTKIAAKIQEHWGKKVSTLPQCEQIFDLRQDSNDIINTFDSSALGLMTYDERKAIWESYETCLCYPNCVEPPGDSLVLTVDKNKVAVGEVVTFTASVNLEDGTIINLYQQVPLGTDFKIGSGTLKDGRCKITHVFTRDGTEVHYACTPGIIYTCDLESNLVPVKVGTDYITTALYAVGILAGAYIIGQIINRRK